jgi:hypothetical protein
VTESAAVPLDDAPTTGVSLLLPVEPLADADALVEADALDDAEELADDEAFCAAADTVPRGAGELAQLGLDVAWVLFLPPVLGLLVRSLALGDAGGLSAGLPPSVTFGLGLSLGPVPPLGLPPAPTDGVSVALAVLLALPLTLPLDDVGGAVEVWLTVPGAVVLVCAWVRCADGDTHGGGEVWPAPPGLMLSPPPTVLGASTGDRPSVAGALLEGVLMFNAEPMASATCATVARAGGTAESTTPTANTAAPNAKAGRSIAWRQSRGRRCWRLCSGACAARWPQAPSPRISLFHKRQIASQIPARPVGMLARAPRDRILSRIRSRPSAPGST